MWGQMGRYPPFALQKQHQNPMLSMYVESHPFDSAQGRLWGTGRIFEMTRRKALSAILRVRDLSYRKPIE